ncbi:MAG: non-ribosomal peptide synthetase [Moorea sp. SIO4A3]|nr:non-ribosomal peptide synthetase [Moorena sp. SIO4A3]
MNFQPFEKSEIEQSINRRFESQVARYPHHIAVKTSECELTYDTLNQAANRLAHQILQQCPPEQELVPILFEHGASMVVAILGVLKAGKGWVPLAASYPQVRLENILSELNVSLLITNQRNLTFAQMLLPNREQIINIDEIDPHLSGDNLDISASPDAIACVLYTSGSTGKPKGVIHNHRNLLHLIRRGTNALKISANDIVSLLPSYSHMAGTNDILRALLNGAMLLPYDLNERGLVDLATWLIAEKITIYHSVPTVFRHFTHTLKGDENFPYLRVIHLGGETLSRQDFDLFKQYFFDNCLLLNNLGCTELSSYRQYLISSKTKLPSNIIPVGYATEDVDVLLLDENGKEVATGCTGEVVLKSPYLALGYWQQAEQTNAAFFPDPEFLDRRCYKTGDVGYFLPDGCLVHVGRKDFQVQIRGYRVEIAEIEAVLFEHPKVKEAAVKHQDNGEEKKLVGYIVPLEGEHLSNKELHNYLKQHLPDYMIPALFVMLAALPLTPNGKVNRLALPDTKQETVSTREDYVAPRTNIEKTLVSIWSQILNLQQVGIYDNFFLLGGDSLQAMRVVSQVRSTLNIELPLRSLFEFPTVIEWAKQIDRVAWFGQKKPDSVESIAVENWEEIELLKRESS